MILALEFGEHGEEVGAEETGNVGANESVELEAVGVGEALELVDDEQALLAHLLFPAPRRQRRAPRREAAIGGGVEAGGGEERSDGGGGAGGESAPHSPPATGMDRTCDCLRS